ncbi:hypothetical protein GCM10011533_18460 [Streptosporangium jomthongense]|uniref:DUF2390 domain-containing protein n=1 Tax=Marinobacter aromaticivorans TaxID=1494078 RepID=A0ABW2IVA8_9GAMM|nr:DUF2390 domain-containing protein [Marinobacter aromaticivorans]GGE66495.1 hypothetical protein GCM10011533_18460 [Streptosporangium jomthongense]
MPSNPETIPALALESMVLPENLEPDNPLWRFALIFWQDSLAQETCLALQNEGWSVTRILCAGWLALNGRIYSGFEDATVTEWRDRVTGSLRTIRLAIPKAQAAYKALRSTLASLELEAERIELALAWRNLMSRNPEHSNMDAGDTLILSNLAAAAPAVHSGKDTTPLLNTLGDIFSALDPGDQPA